MSDPSPAQPVQSSSAAVSLASLAASTQTTSDLDAVINQLVDPMQQHLVFGSPITQTITSTPASMEALNRHLAALEEELGAEAVAKFREYSQASPETYTKKVSAIVRDHQGTSRASKINKVLLPFVRTAGFYLPALSTATQFDPYPSSIVFGAVMCLFQISENYNDFQEQLMDQLTQLSAKMESLMKLELCVYQYEKDIQDTLIDIYGDMLRFCQEALRLHEAVGGKKKHGRIFGRSLVQRFKDSSLSKILDDLQKHVQEYDSKAAYCDKTRLLGLCRLAIAEHLKQSDYRKQALAYFELAGERHEEIRQFVLEISSRQISLQQGMNRGFMENSVALQNERARREAKEAQEQGKAEREARAQKRKSVIEWIPSTDLVNEHDERHEKRQKGTGQWLEKTAAFKAWRSNPRSSTLWVHGKQSCGKSVLSAITWEKLLKAQGTGTALARFYCRRDDQTLNTSSILLRSIFKQICNLSPEIDTNLEALYDSRHLVEKQGPETSQIMNIFPGVINQFTETVILIDGLDECKDPKTSLKHLLQLHSTPNLVVRLLIFSRPDHADIRAALNDVPSIRVDDGENEEDVEAVISLKLSGHEFEFQNNPELLKLVKETFVAKAEGSFLFLDLQATSLIGLFEEDEIKNQLRALPTGIDEMYDAPLRRIVTTANQAIRELAITILVWVTNAARPLSKQELLHAIAIKSDYTSHHDLKIRPSDSQFISICAGLIDLSKEGYYRLVHSSLQDYMKALADSCPPGLEILRKKQREAHSTMSEACLTYLLFEELASDGVGLELDMSSRSEEYPFLQYAAKYWGFHVRLSPSLHDDPVWTVLDNSKLSSASLELWKAEVRDDSLIHISDCQSSSLHLLALFGLARYAKQRDDLRRFDCLTDRFGKTPLDYALLLGWHDMASWLLRRGLGSDHERFATHGSVSVQALRFAIVWGWEDVVERLLFHKFDPGLQDPVDQMSPLMAATVQGDMPIFQMIMKTGVPLDSVDAQGKTALIHAASRGHAAIVIELIEQMGDKGISIDAQDQDGLTALHAAVVSKSFVCVEKLLAHNANTCLATGPRYSCQTALHLAAEKNLPAVIKMLHKKGGKTDQSAIDGSFPIHIAACHGSLAAAKVLHNLGPQVHMVPPTEANYTLIAIAATLGNVEFVEFVLANDPAALRYRQPLTLDTPLHHAARGGQSAVCNLLISKGIEVDVVNADKHTPLIEAVASGDLATLNLLLHHKANANAKFRTGRSVLHYAAWSGRAALVQALLNAGADLEPPTAMTYSAFFYAVDKGHHDVLKELCTSPERLAVLRLADGEEYLLHRAAYQGHRQTVEDLIEFGITQRQDLLQNLPLHLAAGEGHLGIVKSLCTEGIVNAKGHHGRTPLHFAATAGHLPVVAFLLAKSASTEIEDSSGRTALLSSLVNSHIDVARRLMEGRVDISVKDNDAISPMHLAARVGDTDLMKSLLDFGFSLHDVTKNGASVFTMAASSGNVKAVEFLTDRLVNGLSGVDNLGLSPMHYAARGGHVAMVRELHSRGAGVNLCTKFGLSPLGLAARGGHTTVVRELVGCGATTNDMVHGQHVPLLVEAVWGGSENTMSALLQAGANVHEKLEEYNQTALIMAAAARRSELVELLVDAGANPSCRDRFGNNAVDYALGDPRTRNALGNFEGSHSYLTQHQRIGYLHDAIEYSLSQLKRVGGCDLTINLEHRRLMLLQTLTSSFSYLGSSDAVKDAKVPLSELFFYTGPLCQIIECGVCGKHLRGLDFHRCRNCLDVSLCSRCHKDYVKASRTAPVSIDTLEHLESDMVQLRICLLPALENGWQHLVALIQAESLVHPLLTWLESKYEKYAKWDSEYADTFREKSRPGWELLKLTHLAKDFDIEKGNEKIQEMQLKLDSYLREYRGDGRLARFTCHDHNYFECSKADYESLKHDRDFFRADGRVSDAWLHRMTEKYDQLRKMATTTANSSGDAWSQTRYLGSGDASASPTSPTRLSGRNNDKRNAKSVRELSKGASTLTAVIAKSDSGTITKTPLTDQATAKQEPLQQVEILGTISAELGSFGEMTRSQARALTLPPHTIAYFSDVPKPVRSRTDGTRLQIPQSNSQKLILDPRGETGNYQEAQIVSEPIQIENTTNDNAVTHVLLYPENTLGSFLVWACKVREIVKPGSQLLFVERCSRDEMLDGFHLYMVEIRDPITFAALKAHMYDADVYDTYIFVDVRNSSYKSTKTSKTVRLVRAGKQQ